MGYYHKDSAGREVYIPSSRSWDYSYDSRPRSSLATISFVALLIFPPAGVIVGIAAFRECGRDNLRGRGLATFSIVFGSLMVIGLFAGLMGLQ